MPIYAKKTDFIPAPEGTWPAVCVDVVDKGMVESEKYKPRHMIQIRWVMDAEPPLKTGKPHMASRMFGLSMGKKSLLRPFLECWRGKKFSSDDEAYNFDIEKLIGANCQLQIIHNGDYANVQTIVPPARGVNKMYPPEDYVREMNRPGYVPPVMPEEEIPEQEPSYVDQIDDSDIPF
jgi:hypothetical protein